jgi:formylglycine-generating enzyme
MRAIARLGRTFMRRQGPLARSRVASRVTSGFVVLVSSSLASACLVSFDGYERRANGGSDPGNGGHAASSGTPTGGSKADGGRGGAGEDGNPSGTAGDPDRGDAGDGGTGMAGSDGAGGSSGSGGAETAGGGGGTSGSGGSSGSGGTSGNAGSGGGGAKNCPVDLQGPPLIEIPKAGGGFFCMDRTEVTNQEYALFLASNPGTVNQSAVCGFNTSFLPDTSAACAAEEVAKYDPVARPNVPVGCVDWCDAKRYCEWTGKRLCGAIGGGSNPPASFADANASQWFRACSKAGTQKFPYGNDYKASSCNGADVSGFHPADVANKPACVGGYTGLFDMSGNVHEWEDSCSANTGGNDNCLIRGGSIDNIDVLAPSLLCNSSAPTDETPSPATAKRNARDELIGIRCCLDP